MLLNVEQEIVERRSSPRITEPWLCEQGRQGSISHGTPQRVHVLDSEDMGGTIINQGATTPCDDSKSRAQRDYVSSKDNVAFDLLSASSDGHVKRVRLMLQRDDISICARDKDGNTALHLAATNGRVQGESMKKVSHLQ